MGREEQAGAEDAAPESADRLPAWKSLLFSALPLVLFLATAEALLAVAGIAPRLLRDDPYVGFASNVPVFVEARAPDGERILTTARNKRRYFNEQRFPADKANGARRIFCVGGSTTYGRPYGDGTSFCGWLREFLAAADPGVRWEVINAGGISYASYRVAAVVEELAGYDPDLFIIYSGHNEFLEERTYASVRDVHPAVRTLDSLLSRTRTYSGLRTLIGSARAPSDAPVSHRAVLPGEVATILDRSVGPSAYRRDDALREQVLEHYRFNLERMLRIARGAGARAILVAPASNLKDCSPFKSEHSERLSAPDRERWRAAYQRGAGSLAEGRWAQARESFRAAVAIDDRRADGHYRLGESLLALGEAEAALRSFRRARDEDVCPLRALSEIPTIAAEVAAIHDVAFIDFAGDLENAARSEHGHGIAGEEYFLDHVHPTIEANRRLALALVDVMTDRKLLRPAPSWSDATVGAVTRSVEERIDPRRHGIALRNLAKVLSWAGKTEDAARLAEQALAHLGEDAESAFILGSHASDLGRIDDAVAHYRKALRLEPDYVKARNNLGVMLARSGRAEEAIAEYEAVIRRVPDHASARFNLANGLMRLGRIDAAIAHYREILRASPDDTDAHYNLAKAYARKGELDLAARHYEATLAVAPDDDDAHFNLGRVLRALGRDAEADAHFGESQRLDSAEAT
jgi:tetratricopeptide (TPR) repeat protein